MTIYSSANGLRDAGPDPEVENVRMPRRAAEPSGLDLALARVGDRWSLRVVEALLQGPRRFGELQDALPGIATNVLSQRLRHLENEGLALAEPYSQRPRRFTYRLTEAGRDLAGALALLARWGAEHGGGEADGPVHAACGSLLDARWFCPTCEQVVSDDEAGSDFI